MNAKVLGCGASSPRSYGENPRLRNLRRSRQAMSFCPSAALRTACSILNSNSPWTSWSSSLPGSLLQPSPLHYFIHHPITPNFQHSSTPLLLSCMRALIQRVTEAAVVVDNATVGEIGLGLLVLLGIEAADSQEDIEWLAGKIIRLRIFPDGAGAMNQSLADVNGQALVVSQFTLFASTKKGNRPSFIQAAPPELADRMYKDFCQQLEILLGKPVQRGVFGARMSVRLINDGPVTIWIDSKQR